MTCIGFAALLAVRAIALLQLCSCRDDDGSMVGTGKRERFPLVALEDHVNPGGVNDAFWATTESYSKANSDVSPYLVPNEWIAGRLAQYLCLPIVPFAILKPYRKREIFASLGMTANRMSPPRCDAAVCLSTFPDLCAGVLIFDILIANCDRHSGNISVDKQSNPTWMRVIDHERALFGFQPREGIKRLNEMWDRLGITAGAVSGGNRHVFLDAVTSSEAIQKWCDRVYSIPKWYIQETCEYVVEMGIGKRECKAAIDFLQHRKQQIFELARANRHEFTSVTNWGLLPL
jgi:hypothetical protein